MYEVYESSLQDLHVAFAKEVVTSGMSQLLLTAAVAAGKDKIDNGYEVAELVR